MKAVILQTDIRWMDVKANLEAAAGMIERQGKADLFVLPEMFSTGFCVSPSAEVASGSEETLRWMRSLAAERQCALAGSFPVREGNTFRNRFHFVCPDGICSTYDKRHLFAYGGENVNYTAGNQRTIVAYGGFRFLLQVCYDLRFPVFSRCRGDYDVIIYVASWPVSRRKVWNILLRARALENQCYVIGVNRIGSDPSCRYDGGSVIVDPYGETIAACPDGEAGMASAELDSGSLEHIRKRFPVQDDADCFSLLTTSSMKR